MLFTNTTRGGSFAKDPAVIRLNGRYFLYHSTRPNWVWGSALRKAMIWKIGK